MAINPDQYKTKKKRAVNPDAPPRPNLMSHDKKLRDQSEATIRLLKIVEQQQDQIDNLKRKYDQMQQSISQIINRLTKG